MRRVAPGIVSRKTTQRFSPGVAPGSGKSHEPLPRSALMDLEVLVLQPAQAGFRTSSEFSLGSTSAELFTSTLRVETMKRPLCVDVEVPREPRGKCMIGINTTVF